MKVLPVALSLALTAVLSVIAVLLFGLARPAADRSCPLPATTTTRVATSTGWKLDGTSVVRMTAGSTEVTALTVRATGRTGAGGTGACVPTAVEGALR